MIGPGSYSVNYSRKLYKGTTRRADSPIWSFLPALLKAWVSVLFVLWFELLCIFLLDIIRHLLHHLIIFKLSYLKLYTDIILSLYVIISAYSICNCFVYLIPTRLIFMALKIGSTQLVFAFQYGSFVLLFCFSVLLYHF